MILVTGGAGYIGSHILVELLSQHYRVVVIDNFSNSSIRSIERVMSITNEHVVVVEGDITDSALLNRIFNEYDINTVIHLAGLKSVNESKLQPLYYYQNNVVGTLNLVQAMRRHNIKNLIFSSSATVYDLNSDSPLSESCSVGATQNPYGTTKFVCEVMLNELCKSDAAWNIISLRYFNPIGAHSSGEIGEDPRGVPNNLVPYVTQVVVGALPSLSVYGGDYPTKDGTGVRDFIHVVDLAKGHLAALERLDKHSGYHVYNLGTGQGYSVLDVISEFEAVVGLPVPFSITERRPGDSAICFSNPTKANVNLNWHAQYDLSDMLRDAWNWQQKNPLGYTSTTLMLDSLTQVKA